MLRLLWFYVDPIFWRNLWKCTREEQGTKFAIWLTFFSTVVIVIFVGSATCLFWFWPPAILAAITFLVGAWMGSKGFWTKINQ